MSITDTLYGCPNQATARIVAARVALSDIKNDRAIQDGKYLLLICWPWSERIGRVYKHRGPLCTPLGFREKPYLVDSLAASLEAEWFHLNPQSRKRILFED